MKKSIISLSFILAISQLGNVSHAFDNMPASTRNYEVSNSDENPTINIDEDDINQKKKTVVLLIPLKTSEENENSEEEETEEAEELIHHGHKTKRCKVLNPLRKSRRIPVPKIPQKYFSLSTKSSAEDSIENLKDQKSYFRLASLKDTKNILKSLLKTRSAKREDNDAIIERVSKPQAQDSIPLVGQDLKKMGYQRPKKYVCYCIEDNCGTKKSKKPSRPYAMKKPIEPNILAKNSYSTNEENQRISGLLDPEQQILGAPQNLHCPPGAVLVEESDYSERSDRKQHNQKRRPVKKCPAMIIPCESEAQSIGQPTRINIPLAGNRKLNRRVFKVDRKLPFAQKLQSVIGQSEAHGEVPCPEAETSLTDGLNLQNYYNNQQSNFNPYPQDPMTPNLVYPSPYVVYSQYPQYPQYGDDLVGEPQIPLERVDQPYEGNHETSYEATPLGKHFSDIEECIKMFGPNFCIVSTTISSMDGPENAGLYEEEHEEPTIGSHWPEEIRHTAAELPEGKITKWGYPTNAYNSDKVATTYSLELEAGEENEEGDEKNVQHSGQYHQSRITTKPGQYRGMTPQYFSNQPINKRIQPSHNLPQISTSSYEEVGSKQKKPIDLDSHENFVDANSPMPHSDPNTVEYLMPITDSSETRTEDYYDVTEEARENEVPNTTSLESVTEFPQLARTSFTSNWQGAHRVSSPQYLEYTIKPMGKDFSPSSSEDISEDIAEYVPTTHDSEYSRYGTSEYQYSTNSFQQQQGRNGDEVVKSYTTRPSQHVGITKEHTIHGSLDDEEEPYEVSTKSPNTVFVKMEKPWANYRTTIPMENLKGNGFQGSEKITSVYPVIDSEDHIVSTSSRTQRPNNRINENSASTSSDLYYSIQSEQPVANFASKIAKTTSSHRQPVGIIQLTPVNDYSKSEFISSAISGSDNRYTTSYVTMKNAGYGPTPLLGVNDPGQRKFTSSSYPTTNDAEEVKADSSLPHEIGEINNEDDIDETPPTPYYTTRWEIAGPINDPGQRKFTSSSYSTTNDAKEVKTDSSWPQEIEEINNEDSLGETPPIPYYTAQLEIADVNKYSSAKKSSHPQLVGSHQSTNDEQTTEKIHQQFLGSNEPAAENVISTKKDIDYTRKPIESSKDQYTTSYIQNSPSKNIDNAKKSSFDTKLPEEVTNHFNGVPSGNWYYTTQSGREITSSINQEAATDRSGQRQYVGLYHSNPDGIISTTARSDFLNGPSSHLGKIYSSTTTEQLQKSSEQPSEMSSKYNFYSSQSERPFVIVNDRISTEPEDLELALSTVDNNYSTEDITNNYTTAQSILGETIAAKTDAAKPKKNCKGKSRHPSKESHPLIATPSEYENDKEVERPLGDSSPSLGTTLSFEIDSDAKDKLNRHISSNSYDDKVEGVTGPDSHLKGGALKNWKDLISTSSNDSTSTDNNETKWINYSTVVDKEVGEMDRPMTMDTSSSNNPNDYTTKGSTVTDKLITETQSYKKDVDDCSLTTPTIQINNEDPRKSYPGKNYEEKDLTTGYSETVNPQSGDETTRIPKEEEENPHDAFYSSTPMSATHYFGNPSTFSDILKSENIVRDKSPIEGDSNNYSRTNQYSQSTLASDVQNPIEDDHKYNDGDDGNYFSSKNDHKSTVFRQEELTSPRNVVSNTLPTMSTLKEDSSAFSSTEEELITIDNKLSGTTDETQRMTPYDIVGNTPAEENLSTNKNNDDVFVNEASSPMQTSYSTESLAKVESTFSTDNENNNLLDVSGLNNYEITRPTDLLTGTSKFEEVTPSYDLIRDALRTITTNNDKVEATTILTTKTIKEQDDISKKITGSKQFTTPSYNQVDDAPKARTPKDNDENIIGPIASKNDLQSNEYTYTKDYSSVENSRTTEYSPHPYKPTPSSTVVGNTLRNRSFADSEDVTSSTIKYEDSTNFEHDITSKNKESVESPLRSLPITTTGHTDISSSFPTVKSANNKCEKYGDPSSTNQITLQPHYTEYQTTPNPTSNDYTAKILKDDKISDKDRNFLKNAVQKVVQDLISTKSNNEFKNGPKTAETVGAPDQGLLPELPVLKNLFSLPEVKDMTINTVKGLISEASDVPEDSSLSRLKNHVIESVLNGVISDLLPGQSTTRSSAMAVDEHQYENGHWTVIPVTLTPSKGNIGTKSADTISNSIQNIVGRPGIGLQGARLPAVQNIIVRVAENALRKTKDVVNHSMIWDTLNNIIARAESAGKSPHEPLFTTRPLPKAPAIEAPSDSLKNIPIIPVIEHVFKNGQWSEKRTVLGNKRKYFEPKLSTSVTTTARDDNELHTSTSNYKTSTNNANDLGYTTNAADYTLLGESEEKDDKTTMNDIVRVTDNVPVVTTIESVGGTSSSQKIEDKEDIEKAPIKYYSPTDRILTYIKTHQTPGEKTQTTLRPLGSHETTGYYWPSPEMRSNIFSTVDSLSEFKDTTLSDSDEVSTQLTQEPSLVSTENSKICKCMGEEKKNNVNQVGSSLRSSTQELTSVTSDIMEENNSNLPNTIYHLSGDDGKHIEYTTEEYIGGKNPQTTPSSHTDPEKDISTKESPEFSSTIHHLDVIEDNDYTTEDCISKENLSATEETTEGNATKVENTQLSAFQSTLNYLYEEGDRQSEEVATQEYIKETDAPPTDKSEMNIKEIQSSSTESSGTNASSNFANNVVEAENYRNVNQDVSTPEIVQSTVYGEGQVEMTSGDKSTTQTLLHKFTKIPKYYDSTQEATTLTRGLVGAAKSRGGSHHLQENIKDSSNFVTPKWDPTYFGKISLNDVNPSEDKISDLTNTDLFYVGDGVKIPLMIQRMPDGSYALSISEKICENFVKRKCPCCVPREGEIVEERKQLNDAEDAVYETTSKRNSYNLASFEPTESSGYENISKKRYVRSTSGSDVIVTSASPVKSFVRKYNLTLNLAKDHIPGESWITNEKATEKVRNTGRTKRLGSSGDKKVLNLFENNNQIQRDDSEEQTRIIDDNSEIISKESNSIRRSEFDYDMDTNSFIHSLVHIRDVPEYKRAEIVVNALDGLINSASAKNLNPIGRQSMVRSIDEDSTDDQNRREDSSEYDLNEVENEMAGYGYQKDNPILERIRFIKEKQHEHGQYKYQQNIDRQAKGKMKVLKTVLHWLREVFLESKVNDKN